MLNECVGLLSPVDASLSVCGHFPNTTCSSNKGVVRRNDPDGMFDFRTQDF